MSRVRSTDSALEKVFADELTHRGITTYSKNDKSVFGNPDFVFRARKVAVFCDSEFWHGYDWENTRHAIKSRQDFWIPKIEKNIRRDKKVTAQLKDEGWTVLRFWEFRIKKELEKCVNEVITALRDPMPQAPFRTIDLCAGIGGIRRGFELCGSFRNVLSYRIDENHDISC